MHIVFFTHPSFVHSQSMPRFAKFLSDGMRSKGHKVDLWSPSPKFYNFSVPKGMKKWLGYIDQYLVFPYKVRQLLKSCSPETLFVFADQALGPWVPLVSNRPHVVHCHDFLAQRSALSEIEENPVSYTGKKYQEFIGKGYRQGKNFISVSEKTKEDLQKFLKYKPHLSEVVYNGITQPFTPMNPINSRDKLGKKIGFELGEGYLLHVGGNQWYKNRLGVIEIYNEWRKSAEKKLPLLLVGKEPNAALKEAFSKSRYKADIHFLTKLEDEFVRLAYAGASVFLFPSLAEGFGWPIAEAMASGCPVITTNEAPMTEVSGTAAILIPRRPGNSLEAEIWAREAAKIVKTILELPLSEREKITESGIINAKRFNSETALNKIEKIYQNIVSV